jgi:hypothetical protein
MNRAAVVSLIALTLLGFTCGDRRPVVVNELDCSINVRSTWADGTEAGGEVPPSGRLFLAEPPRYPEEVVIFVPDGETYKFNRANSPELIGRAIAGSVVGWKVTDFGVLPLTAEELQ